MFGIIILPLFVLWIIFSFRAAKKVNRFIWGDKPKNNFTAIIGQIISPVVLWAFIFFLPCIDQLIAYPKWQQLCSTTSDFEWGPGMDAEKAHGRSLVVYGGIHETTIFPNIKVTYFSRQFKDVETGELILNMPHAKYHSAKGMFYIPTASGNKDAIFLSKCTTRSQKVIDSLNQLNLNIIEYKN